MSERKKTLWRQRKQVVITVNMYGEVRRLHMAGVSQRQIARQLGIDRKTVRKYIHGDVVPWEKTSRKRDVTVLTPEVKAFIAACLEDDEEIGIRKQQHTARRIYQRLVHEKNFTGGESTVRAYVRELKEKAQEAFVPLAFQPGEAMQIDWGEATIWLSGKKLVVYLFCARLCYSDAPFVAAYRRQNSESFLDALIRTMEYFGGTPRRVIFDNAKTAVKDGFGANARIQENYEKLSAHYGFEPVFCNVASGNEKGLVEGLVGFARRNFCVPIPHVETMDELNLKLEENCKAYLAHTVQGKKVNVGTLYQQEQEALQTLPGYRYDPAKRTESPVSRFSTVRYDTNNYSVPVKFCGKKVALRILPETIEIYYNGEQIACHPRCFEHSKDIYELEHYLPLLERKGRAIFQAKPVLDNVPSHFLDWLKSQQNLKSKELIELLRRSLVLGCDAVMRGETLLSESQRAEIMDTVQVSDVDLSAYDACFLGTREGVCP